MFKIGVIRWQGRCHRHPRYHPADDGLGGIKGGCVRCQLLLEIYTQHDKLVRLLREFGSRADIKMTRTTDKEPESQMSLLDLV